jgi:endoglucanase
MDAIPRRRGFNLQAGTDSPGEAYRESDFAMMAEWGFDFARLPLSYWTWSSRGDWSVIYEKALEDVDRAVELGRRYRIHININFHRIPGYCVNGRDLEPADLFSPDTEERRKALSAAVLHWKFFARRYAGIPNDRLSFDLINEPPWMSSEEPYVEIVKALVEGIREMDPGRLIFADGIDIGQTPVMGIVDLGIAQSTRGYLPKAVSHYTANWVPRGEFETLDPPTWPLSDDSGRKWDRETLRHEYIDKWKPLVDRGVPVHVGEWGAFNRTPHKVVMAWMADCLSLWKEAGWGFSLWQLRGAFGVLDSGRPDVTYEKFRGCKLDREMLELLRGF